MLDWSAAELAARAGVSKRTMVKIEAAVGVPSTTTGTIQKLQAAFEAAGIEFIGSPDNRPGIRIGLPRVRALPPSLTARAALVRTSKPPRDTGAA